jgi:hypothetical protein
MPEELLGIFRQFDAKYKGAPEKGYQTVGGQPLEAAEFVFPTVEKRFNATREAINALRKKGLLTKVALVSNDPARKEVLHVVAATGGHGFVTELKILAEKIRA